MFDKITMYSLWHLDASMYILQCLSSARRLSVSSYSDYRYFVRGGREADDPHHKQRPVRYDVGSQQGFDYHGRQCTH